VVFIHGGEQDHGAWALQSRYFAYHGHNVLAPDLPGHGRSAWPAADVDRSTGGLDRRTARRRWHRARIDSRPEHGIARGTRIRGARAGAHRTKLVLLGASAPMPVAQSLLDAAQADDHAALEMINVWSHSSRARLGGNTAPGMWMLGANLRLMERQAPGVLYADFKACNDYTHGADAAARVECPTLIVIGSPRPDDAASREPRIAQDLSACAAASRSMAAAIR
jgi:pimeloyl-ACP methyl ester carboxylesterase